MSMHLRYSIVPISLATALFLGGCSATQSSTVVSAVKPATLAGLHGHARGGQQPINGAVIQLYAVGTGGDGSPSTPLITTTTVTTGADGGFTISNDYQCVNTTTGFTATDVYITATGGDPTPGSPNVNLTLMAALGQCSTLSSSTDINLNELTSVAATAALQPYMTSITAVGSGTGDASALDAAFTLANNYVTVATGQSPGTNVPSGYTVPIKLIDTLGDVIVPCVNSASATDGTPSSSCNTLFSLTTPPSGTAPTDTVGALLDIATYPTQNTPQLYDQVGGTGTEFLPDLSYAPSTWAIALIPDTTVYLTPSPVNFGSQSVGTSFSNNILMINTGSTYPLYVSGIALTGAVNGNFSIGTSSNCTSSSGQVAVQPGSYCTITVAFSPSMAGSQTAMLVITSNSTTSQDVVMLSGTGN